MLVLSSTHNWNCRVDYQPIQLPATVQASSMGTPSDGNGAMFLTRSSPLKYALDALLTQIDEHDASRPLFQHPVRGDCYFAWSTIVAATSPSQLDHIMIRYNIACPYIRFETDGQIYLHIQSYALREILVTYMASVKALSDAEFGQEPSVLESQDVS